MVRVTLLIATLTLPATAMAGALTGPGSGLRCTDSVTGTFDAAFYGNGICVVDGRQGASGFVRGERLCRVAGPNGGDLRVGPYLSFTWDKAGPVTAMDGQCRRI